MAIDKLRLVSTVILSVFMVATIVFNALAATGTPPFIHTTGNVSYTYDTPITPAGYTFSIWGLIYTGLLFTVVYGITLTFRTLDGKPVADLGGAVPYSFLIIFACNLVLNVAWLFLWDRFLFIPGAVVLFLIFVSNAVALTLSANSFVPASATLLEKSPADFWCGVLVLNFYEIYTAWTTLAFFIQLSITLIYNGGISANLVGVLMFCIIPILFKILATLQNITFADTFSFNVSAYFVYLWASVGIFVAKKDTDFTVFLWMNMVVAASLCLVRLMTVVGRNINRKLKQV